MTQAGISIRRTSFLATFAVGSALLLAACGSDGNSNDGTESAAGETTQKVKSDATGTTGTTGKKNKQSADFKPNKKAPDSAGDRKKAPDDVVSNRPGSKVKPVNP